MSLLPLDGLLLCRLVTPSTMSLGPIYTTGWRERTWMEVCCQRNQCDNKASSRALDLIQCFFFFPISGYAQNGGLFEQHSISVLFCFVLLFIYYFFVFFPLSLGCLFYLSKFSCDFKKRNWKHDAVLHSRCSLSGAGSLQFIDFIDLSFISIERRFSPLLDTCKMWISSSSQKNKNKKTKKKNCVAASVV